jgi:2-methylcitrate dehydratase PrpD
MMRCIDHPTMIKDSSGWGAQAGVSAALLAAEGFTGAPAELLADGSAVWDHLGDRWMVLEQCFKPHPVCRWSHPAIEATIDLVRRHSVEPGEIQLIEVGTFAAAARLATGIPQTTEHAE